MYGSGNWKPDRESAIRLYDYLSDYIDRDLESQIREKVKEDMATKLFVVKETLDQMLKDVKNQK